MALYLCIRQRPCNALGCWASWPTTGLPVPRMNRDAVKRGWPGSAAPAGSERLQRPGRTSVYGGAGTDRGPRSASPEPRPGLQMGATPRRTWPLSRASTRIKQGNNLAPGLMATKTRSRKLQARNQKRTDPFPLSSNARQAGSVRPGGLCLTNDRRSAPPESGAVLVLAAG